MFLYGVCLRYIVVSCFLGGLWAVYDRGYDGGLLADGGLAEEDS